MKSKNLYFVSGLLYSSYIFCDTHREVFTAIYDTAEWGRNDNGEGFSGGGSLLKNTRPYMSFLENFIKANNIKTIVDAGCGDWEFSRFVNWHGAAYIGYDVVAHVIDKNIKKFAKPNITFAYGNLITEDLPSADLLICKHVLQHLPNSDILLFLQQLQKFKYCLITNQVDPETLSGDNSDIAIGGGRKIDLTKHPFNLEGVKVFHYSHDDGMHQILLIDNSTVR